VGGEGRNRGGGRRVVPYSLRAVSCKERQSCRHLKKKKNKPGGWKPRTYGGGFAQLASRKKKKSLLYNRSKKERVGKMVERGAL